MQYYDALGQYWALYGPRAKYGPRDDSDRPAKDYMITRKRYSVGLADSAACGIVAR